MQFTSQIKVGALKLISLSSMIFFPFVHVCDPSLRTCSHGRRVQGEEQWGVPYSAYCPLAPSSATPLEELPAAAAECSAETFVTPTGHKAVSLIAAHLECSHLTDLPISASESLGLRDFAHYLLASSCTPSLNRLIGQCPGTYLHHCFSGFWKF